MAKINQIIAVEKGVKSRAEAAITQSYHLLQKGDQFGGFTKTYQKKDEEGDELPSETKRVQARVDDVLKEVAKSMGEVLDITARKDWSNTKATADVTVNGTVIVPAAPVSYLLYLEKQLNDLKTTVSAIPVLSGDENWKMDTAVGLYKSDGAMTQRTKKEQRALVLYPATDKHPAQTQPITEDILVGYWNTVKFSGAWPRDQKADLLERISILLQAVKFAREAANSQEETASPKVGEKVFTFLMGG